MASIEIPIRELHARTGHYVRKARQQLIVITNHGKKVAELHPYAPSGPSSAAPSWARRLQEPGFREVVAEPVSGKDSTDIIAEDRDR